MSRRASALRAAGTPLLTIVALVLAAAVTAQDTGARPRPAPAGGSRPADPRAAAALADTARAESTYRIGPKDILKVTVYGHEDLTHEVLVQADGSFTFPLVGRVAAAGSTPNELERSLATLLARGFIRNPQVTVVVQEYRSKLVYVVGEVEKPGAFPLTGSTTLVEILAKAGPMTSNAAAEVLVLRPKAGAAGPTLPSASDPNAAPAATVTHVRLKDLQAGAAGQNLLLEGNDTIFVPQAPKVFVSGEVRNPGAYAYFPGMTARQLISVAGGLTQYGSDGRLRLVRTVDGRTDKRDVHLDEAVHAGDTLEVRRKLF